MTLTERLTLWIVGWVACILLVFNVASTVWFHTQSLNNLRRSLRLELNELHKLADEVPHLALTPNGWERPLLLASSSVRFLDEHGEVTSSASGADFPAELLPYADEVWNRGRGARTRAFLESAPVSFVRPSGVAYWAMPVSDVYAERFVHWLPLVRRGGKAVLGVEEPFVYPNGRPGWLIVAASVGEVEAEERRFVRTLLWSDALGVSLLAFGTYVVARRGIKPLHDLIRRVQDVEWSRTTRVAVDRAPHEVRLLADKVNQLLEQAERAMDEQRRFIADASHELRTPLAILAGHANLLRRWGSRDERVWEPAVRHIVNEVARLQNLVDRLLLLSRLDAGLHLGGEPIPAAAVRDLMLRLREDGELLRPDLEWMCEVHLPAAVKVAISAEFLREILLIIVDNAMQHTPAGGRVRLAAEADEQSVRFSVEDTGEGIPEPDLARVFDRFYRAEKSRSRRHGGAGLGLSICRQLVEAHRGRITIDSELGKGTTVTVRLPADAGRQRSG